MALNRQLTSEMEAKDEELQDHIEGGSTLTRKSLKTPKFDLETSCKKAMASQGTRIMKLKGILFRSLLALKQGVFLCTFL